MNPSVSIAPWLSVRDSFQALSFYKSAFDAVEVYRLDFPDGVIARLSIHGAEFWIGDESPNHGNYSPETLGGTPVRIILTVPNPLAAQAKAIAAGAHEIFPVTEEYGWRIGRIKDPFGHQWEIGCMIA